uniref:RanBD1 domain-containing protein n=1 Tax=Macrostomum lignano TaxID=282301 RepID=A0A1I8HZX8_9PLAT
MNSSSEDTAGIEFELSEDTVKDLRNTDRNGDNANQSRTSRWIVRLKKSLHEFDLSILLEKQRKDANVRPGDTMHNLTVTLMKNGTTQWRIVWNDRNLTTFRLHRNEHIVIEQRIENATAVDIELYIRLTARVLPYPDAPRSTASQRYVVRRIDFLCASMPFSNCSVLASIAAQFSSYQEMKELDPKAAVIAEDKKKATITTATTNEILSVLVQFDFCSMRLASFV